jgi:hypothetical protein
MRMPAVWRHAMEAPAMTFESDRSAFTAPHLRPGAKKYVVEHVATRNA